MAKHYIRLDEKNRIIKGFSSDFEVPLDTDICINEDGERHFELLEQVNPTLTNQNNIYLYKYENGEVVERTQEEINTDMIPIIQNNKNTEIQNAYSNSLEDGFTSSATGTPIAFKYGITDQMKFMQLMLSVNANMVTYPVPIPTKNGDIVNLDQIQLGQLFKDINTFAWTEQNKLHTLLAQVQACTTIDEVNAISW